MDTSEQQGRHFWVSGKVQGVFFRRFTQQQASLLNLKGWVRNTADNRVELKAFGTESQLTALTARLWQGPPAAEVTAVEVENIPWESWDDFSVAPDDVSV